MALVPFPSPQAGAFPLPPDEDDDNSAAGKMSFLEHLDELRKRIVNSAIAIGVCVVIGFAFINRIVDFFPPHQQAQVRLSLAGSLKGIVCQRLIPTADGKSRVPVLELLVINGRIQQAIIDPLITGDIEAIVAEGEYYGMVTFDQSLVKLVGDGTIDLVEAMNTASNPHDLKVMLEREGIMQTGQFAAANFT